MSFATWVRVSATGGNSHQFQDEYAIAFLDDQGTAGRNTQGLRMSAG